jgi:hypothetical protein
MIDLAIPKYDLDLVMRLAERTVEARPLDKPEGNVYKGTSNLMNNKNNIRKQTKNERTRN